MKKFSILPALFLVFTACNNSGEEPTAKKEMYSDLVAEGLKGDISSYEEAPYKTDSTGKAGEMDSCCISVYDYDENGNNIKWTSKDSKGTVKEGSTVNRYENGMWKGGTNTKDGKTVNSMETTMDDKGNYTGGNAYDSAGKLEFYYTGLSQNEQGQVLSWKQWDKDSVFRQEGTATYDKYLQTGFTLKDSVGKVKNSSTSKYNDKGEQTERTNTNVIKDSSITTVTKFTYEAHDDMGNWTQRTEWNDKGKATKIVKRTYTYRKEAAKK
jgi:hypothetical protein